MAAPANTAMAQWEALRLRILGNKRKRGGEGEAREGGPRTGRPPSLGPRATHDERCLS